MAQGLQISWQSLTCRFFDADARYIWLPTEGRVPRHALAESVNGPVAAAAYKYAVLGLEPLENISDMFDARDG